MTTLYAILNALIATFIDVVIPDEIQILCDGVVEVTLEVGSALCLVALASLIALAVRPTATVTRRPTRRARKDAARRRRQAGK